MEEFYVSCIFLVKFLRLLDDKFLFALILLPVFISHLYSTFNCPCCHAIKELYTYPHFYGLRLNLSRFGIQALRFVQT